MRFEKITLGGAAAQLAQHVLYGDSGPLEYGFAHHHARLFLNVVLPIHVMIVSWRAVPFPCGRSRRNPTLQPYLSLEASKAPHNGVPLLAFSGHAQPYFNGYRSPAGLGCRLPEPDD